MSVVALTPAPLDALRLLFESSDRPRCVLIGATALSVHVPLEGHIEYCTRVCRRIGLQFDRKTQVICQVFRVLWPKASPGAAG